MTLAPDACDETIANFQTVVPGMEALEILELLIEVAYDQAKDHCVAPEKGLPEELYGVCAASKIGLDYEDGPHLSGYGVSTPECLTCWGELGACAATTCQVPCVDGADVDCLTCLEVDCAESFKCSGASQTYLPECGDGVCDAETGEDAITCEGDCYCGNGTCDADETMENCPVDCTVHELIFELDLSCTPQAGATNVSVLIYPNWQVAHAMTKVADDQWTLTMPFDAAGTVGYQYAVGLTLENESLVDDAFALAFTSQPTNGAGQPICGDGVLTTDYNLYAHREVEVEGSVTVEDTFSRCHACDVFGVSTAGRVTLSVDMSEQPVNPGCPPRVFGGFMAGGAFWDPNLGPVFSQAEGELWTTSFYAVHGDTYGYKLLNAYDGAQCHFTSDDFDYEVYPEGLECIDVSGNRHFTMPSSGDITIAPFCYQGCDECEGGGACDSDGVCEPAQGEDSDNCVDCAGQGACDLDGVCEHDDGEHAGSCADCQATCGDGACHEGEFCFEDCDDPAPCCLSSQVDAGCSADPGVESCVCSQDGWCCSNAWDDPCVDLAMGSCGLSCAGDGETCGDGVCEGAEGDENSADYCLSDCCAGSCGGKLCGFDGCAQACGQACDTGELCVNGSCLEDIVGACDGLDETIASVGGNVVEDLVQNIRNWGAHCDGLLPEGAPEDSAVDCVAQKTNGADAFSAPNLIGNGALEVSYDCLACWGELGVCLAEHCSVDCGNGLGSSADCKACVSETCHFNQCSGMDLFKESGCTPDCGDNDCGDDGCGGSCNTCDEGLACDDTGVCVTLVCTPGQRSCDNTSTLTACNATGTGTTTESCGADAACLGGECVSCDGDNETHPGAEGYPCNPYCADETQCASAGQDCMVSGDDETSSCVAFGDGAAGDTCEHDDDCGQGHICAMKGDAWLCHKLCFNNDGCEGGNCNDSVAIGPEDSVRVCELLACTPTCAGVESCGQDDGCGGTCTGCPGGEVCDAGSQTCVEDSPCQGYCSTMTSLCTIDGWTPDWGDDGCLDTCKTWSEAGSGNPATLGYEHSLACRNSYLEELAAQPEGSPTLGLCELAGPASAHCVDFEIIWPEEAKVVGDCPEGTNPGDEDCPYLMNVSLLGGESECTYGEIGYTVPMGVQIGTAAGWTWTLKEAGDDPLVTSADFENLFTDSGKGSDTQTRSLPFPHMPGEVLQLEGTLTLEGCNASDPSACELTKDIFVRADFCPPVVDFLTPLADGASLPLGTDNLTLSLSGIEGGGTYTLSATCEGLAEDLSGTEEINAQSRVREGETRRVIHSIEDQTLEELMTCSLKLTGTDRAGNQGIATREITIRQSGCTPTCAQSAGCPLGAGCGSDCGQDDGCGGLCPPCPSDCSAWHLLHPELGSGRFYIGDGETTEQVYCVQGTGVTGLLSQVGGGWTQLAVFADDGADSWTYDDKEAWTGNSLGTLDGVESAGLDYRAGLAFSTSEFNSLAFSHHGAGPGVQAWLEYGVKAPGDEVSFTTLIGEASEPGALDCSPPSYPLTKVRPQSLENLLEEALCADEGKCEVGTDTGGGCFCDTQLYINATDHQGQCGGCSGFGGGSTGSQHAMGPTWNIAGANGCDFDRPGLLGGVGPNAAAPDIESDALGFAHALDLNQGLPNSGGGLAAGNNYNLRMYAQRAICGNGQVEHGEACDDGEQLDNASLEDTCSADCKVSLQCPGDQAGVIRSYGTSTYLLCSGKRRWHMARQACESMGAHLVKVDTPAENNAMIKLAADHIGAEGTVWLGLNRYGISPDSEDWGFLQWPDGSTVPLDGTHTSFFPQAYPGADNLWLQTHDLNAVYLQTDASDELFRTWAISKFDTQRYYICEIED